jgi:anti-sigma factor RsiW
MDCRDARLELHDLLRARLAPEDARAVRRHLEGCPGCRRAEAAEALLDELLLEHLPHRPAPERLRRRLAEGAADRRAPDPKPRRGPAWPERLTTGVAVVLAVLVVGLLVERSASRGGPTEGRLVEEAVGDHLRLLVSQHPIEIESGGPHQVKPWFEGRLDFAPAVPLPDVPDLRLRGGAVGWLLDRRAALIQYSLRLHAVTLLAYRADPRDGPDGAAGPRGLPARVAPLRGFGVVTWRAGEIGYAVVSDVGAPELLSLAQAMAATTGVAPATR